MLVLKRIGRQAGRFVLPLALAVLWQAAAIWLDKQTVLPRLDAVAAVLFHPTEKILITGSLLENMAISLLRVILGFLLAVLTAVPLGLAMGYFKRVNHMVDSTVEMLRPIPPLAWVPLILAWLGIRGVPDIFPFLATSPIWSGIQFSTLIIIFIGAFFPILLNTIQGVRSIPREYIESARTLGAKGLPLLVKILIPASLPLIVTGLRIGLGIGWMCLVAAEMMPGSSSGLGYLIWYAYELLRADIIVAGMVAIGAIGFIMDRGFRWLEGKLFWGGMG
ncbi:binding-protein-dependent transport systems inner membrane component [Desulfatibacillum aliphaticivorans]|uniref:Binding-protein-dependent transport systems inner membrane component n=1 Tax=Desulfatibacillum aliphaticivorans TaxID=218208 RepID=B8F9Y3_DESAL|nr:ABC transporter permease [Desulfatibacillum aliphaticivorans]ACL03079.1 binding-protein-dependent transport systems inner membrane component [Desulfatibacillum aliphaticivorans]